jgi:hypothetical protein
MDSAVPDVTARPTATDALPLELLRTRYWQSRTQSAYIFGLHFLDASYIWTFGERPCGMMI